MRGGRCAAYVSVRMYSAPGMCEKRNGLQKIVYEGRKITVCMTHAVQAQRGHIVVGAPR